MQSKDSPIHDVTGSEFASLLNPDDYSKSQAFGLRLKNEHSHGLFYPSVRDPKGFCIGIFRAQALRPPKQRSHLRYVYNAKRREISDVFRIKTI